MPLLVSPFIAFTLGVITYWVFKKARKMMGINKETCICLGQEKEFVPLRVLSNDRSAGNFVIETDNQINPRFTVADANDCADIYTDKVWGVYMQTLLDVAHIISAAAVSFARGLNDTPKIAGLLVATQAVDIRFGMVAIAIGMAIGGLLNARRVAETMSNKITEINHGQGFSANLVTSFLVIIASKFWVPVSTTHVAVGAIFGIGMVGRKRDARVIGSIILSWFITLPVAMVFSALIYLIIS